MSPEYLTTDESALGNAAGAAPAIPDDVLLMESQREPGLFGLLVDRYQAPFLRLAERVVRSRTDAEDVVQEAFVKIYRYAKRFRQGEDRKFSSWAYKIVLNTAITHYHKIRKREWQLPEGVDPTQGEAHVQFREASLNRETEAVVRSVLDVIPEEFRELLRAYYLEDKPYQAIAAQNGMTVGALKMKLFRARKLFRKHLIS